MGPSKAITAIPDSLSILHMTKEEDHV
jgi:hypothetical protein